VDHVTASEPRLLVEPPSVTILKTFNPAKPLNVGLNRSCPFTSAPQESLFARFLNDTDVTLRPSITSCVLMSTRGMSVEGQYGGEVCARRA